MKVALFKAIEHSQFNLSIWIHPQLPVPPQISDELQSGESSLFYRWAFSEILKEKTSQKQKLIGWKAVLIIFFAHVPAVKKVVNTTHTYWHLIIIIIIMQLCLQTDAFLSVQHAQSIISIHSQSCFWRSDKSKSNIYFPFSLILSLREISGFWSPKCFTMFSS